jgi:hypothetical protein
MPTIRLTKEKAAIVAAQQQATTDKLVAMLNPNILYIEIIEPEVDRCILND